MPEPYREVPLGLAEGQPGEREGVLPATDQIEFRPGGALRRLSVRQRLGED